MNKFFANRFSLPALLLSGAIGIAAGYGLAAVKYRPDAPVPANTSAATQSADVPAPNPQSSFIERLTRTSAKASPRVAATAELDELWGQVVKADELPNATVMERLRELAQNHPGVLRELMSRYGMQTDANVKSHLRFLFSGINSPEITDFSLRLATAADPVQRKEGFELLSGLSSENARAHHLARYALQTEQDPQVLSEAVKALAPTVVDPSETQAIITRLNDLTQHGDANVRGASLHMLAQWDKIGTVSEGSIYQALTDHVSEVRSSALIALSERPVRSDRMKNALIGIIRNANEVPEVKAAALQALQHFTLSTDEYASYHQVSAQLKP